MSASGRATLPYGSRKNHINPNSRTYVHNNFMRINKGSGRVGKNKEQGRRGRDSKVLGLDFVHKVSGVKVFGRTSAERHDRPRTRPITIPDSGPARPTTPTPGRRSTTDSAQRTARRRTGASVSPRRTCWTRRRKGTRSSWTVPGVVDLCSEGLLSNRRLRAWRTSPTIRIAGGVR